MPNSSPTICMFAEIKNHQTMQRTSSFLQLSFCQPMPNLVSVSCSWLTGVEACVDLFWMRFKVSHVVGSEMFCCIRLVIKHVCQLLSSSF